MKMVAGLRVSRREARRQVGEGGEEAVSWFASRSDDPRALLSRVLHWAARPPSGALWWSSIGAGHAVVGGDGEAWRGWGRGVGGGGEEEVEVHGASGGGRGG